MTRQRLVSGRRVRDWIFVPAILQFAIALQLVYGPGSQVGFLRYLVGAGTFAVGRTIILPFTWAFSLALAAYGVYLFGVRYREDPLRTVVYPVSLPFGATFLFETTYNALGNAHFNGNWLNWYGTPWVMGVALASAAAIVLATLRYWRITRGLGVALAAWVGVWVAWYVLGYPQVYDTAGSLWDVAFGINVAEKLLSYVVIAALVSGGARTSPGVASATAHVAGDASAAITAPFENARSSK